MSRRPAFEPSRAVTAPREVRADTTPDLTTVMRTLSNHPGVRGMNTAMSIDDSGAVTAFAIVVSIRGF
jgi:hypothetical protein